MAYGVGMEPVHVMIREARTDAGLTQAQLAAELGTAQSMIARYESGEVSPTVGALARLLGACGRTLTLATVEEPARAYRADPTQARQAPGSAGPAGSSDYLNRPDSGWRPSARTRRARA